MNFFYKTASLAEVTKTDAVDRLAYSREMLEIARNNVKKAEEKGAHLDAADYEKRANHWTDICEALQAEIEEAQND